MVIATGYRGSRACCGAHPTAGVCMAHIHNNGEEKTDMGKSGASRHGTRRKENVHSLSPAGRRHTTRYPIRPPTYCAYRANVAGGDDEVAKLTNIEVGIQKAPPQCLGAPLATPRASTSTRRSDGGIIGRLACLQSQLPPLVRPPAARRARTPADINPPPAAPRRQSPPPPSPPCTWRWAGGPESWASQTC